MFVRAFPALTRPGIRLLAWTAAAVASGAVLRAAEAEQLAAVDDGWKHFQSANFEVYSRNDEKDSRELLHNLELLRAVFTERFKVVERARLPVTAYYFRRETDFRAYVDDVMAKNDRFKGFYMGGVDRAIISMAPISDWDSAQRVIFHEYVHHLFRSMEQDPPVWFNEGMAELLAGIRVEGATLEIGRPLESRLFALREGKLLPLDKLFAVDHGSPYYTSKDHTGMFYAESWALLHYWYFGQSKLSPEAVARFTRVASDRKVAAKVNLRVFFRECFAMDYPDMQRALERYVESGSYKFGKQPAPTIAAASTYAMRAVPRDEIRVRLAELAVRVKRAPEAKLALLEAADKKPADPRVLEVLGADALVDHDQSRASERWEEAVAAGSRNGAVLRELSLLESRQWFENFDFDFRLPPERAERLRARLLRSIEFEPLQSAAYEMLAWLEAYAEKPVYPNVNIVQRNFAQLTHKDRTMLALAFTRLRAGKKDEGVTMIEQMAALQPDRWTLQASETIRARLENRLVQRVDPAVTGSVTAVPLSPTWTGMQRTPSVELPPKP